MLEPPLVLKFLHVLSSAVLFGSILGVCVFVSLAAAGRRSLLPDVARLGVQASWITAAALLTQPVTGMILIKLQEDAPFQPWLAATYALYLLALAAWVAGTLILRRIGSATFGGGGSIRTWAILAWGTIVLLIGIYFLMIGQPALWGRVG